MQAFEARAARPHRADLWRRRSTGLLCVAVLVGAGCKDRSSKPAPTLRSTAVPASISTPVAASAPTAGVATNGSVGGEAPSLAPALPVPKKLGCPASMAFLVDPGFCIHKWEAHLVYPDGSLHDPYRVPPFPSAMNGLLAKASAGTVPQGYVGRGQAELACKNAGFRLCALDEWQLACKGPKNSLFPYGVAYRIPGKCNTHKFPEDEHLVKQFYPDAGWTTQEMNDPRINRFPGGLAKTGQYRKCTNAYGVFDMVGNLQEWVSSFVDGGSRDGNAILMGDHYMGQGKNYEGCRAKNVGHGYYPDKPTRNQRDYSTGIRCCADPR